MLTHHIQHTVIERLTTHNALSFSELKPDDVDNKLFTYHLKITIREGLVEKSADRYKLTSAGKKLWKRIKESPEAVSSRAHSVLYLAVHSKDKGWLLYTRTTHPLKDRAGFMHAVPLSREPIAESAARQAYEKTGLVCTFEVAGSGFFRIYDGDDLESFTNFTMLVCTDPQGMLAPSDPHATYEWVKNPDFSSPNMLPNMPKLASMYASGKFPFFIDETVNL